MVVAGVECCPGLVHDDHGENGYMFLGSEMRVMCSLAASDLAWCSF